MKNILMVNKLVVWVLVLFVVSACSKQNQIEDNLVPDGDTGIQINLLGIEPDDDNIEKLGAKEFKTEDKKVIATSSIQMEDGMEAMVSLTEESVDKDAEMLQHAEGRHMATATRMAAGVKYVVVFYDDENKYVATINATAQTQPTTLKQFRYNKTYTWFAYSYNSTDAITLNSTSSPTISDAPNKGLLYASGTITTSNSQENNRLNILFKRKTAIIEVVIDGRGIFDRLTDLEMVTTTAIGLKSGTFNLRTGKYNTTYTSYTPTFGNSNFVNFRSSSADTIRKVEMYTVDTVNAITGFAVKFNKITQPTDLYSKNTSYQRTYTNVTFNLPNNVSFVPKFGKKYRVVFTPIYRHLTVNGVDWAWGDLYYDEIGNKAYAFRHANSNFYNMVVSTGAKTVNAVTTNNTIIPHWNGFWNYKARKPGVGQPVNQVDPCTLVFPQGRWKMPANFNSINNIPVSTSAVPRRFSQRSTDPLRYIEVLVSNADWAPYSWRTNLIFMEVGYRSSTTDNTVRTHATTEEEGTAGMYYWTTGSLGQYYYARTPTYLYTATIDSGHSITEGTNLGLRIRCVRDANFVYKTNL